jgi:DNA-binding Lrp family transcriptional regulator
MAANFNETTQPADFNAFNPALVAADTANLQAGASSSIFENARNFTGAALVSGFASIYNTAANYLGSESVDVAKWIDENDSDMGAYYRANKSLVDVAGFVGFSLIPGGLALKGLQLAKAGTALGPFSRALGFAQSRQQYFLDKGLKELATEGGTVFSLINKNKLASMGWGVADQMLNVAGFETAVAATMKQSPLLEKDDWADVGKHIALTSLAFGGIGGGIEAIALNSIFKTATKKIDVIQRQYDTLTKVQGDLPLGDQAYGILSSLLQLPTTGRNIEFTYQLAGKEHGLELPTKDALERVVSSTRKRAWEDFDTVANQLAQSDPQLGQQFAGYVRKLVDDGLQQGSDVGGIIERLQDHLLNAGKITRISEKASEGTDSIFYLRDTIDKTKLPQIKDLDSFLSTVVSRAPTGSDVSKNPYKLVGAKEEVKLGIISNAPAPEGSGFSRYASIEDAFKSGSDAIVLANGTLRINPKSKLFQQVQDPILTPRSYFNVRTGAFTDTAFPTVADVASTAKPLAMTAIDHLVSGGRNFSFKAFDEFNLKDLDTVNASARYVYANELKVVPQKVSDTDIPLLTRIFEDGADKWKNTILVSADKLEKKVGDIRDFGEWLKQQKLAILQSSLFEKTEDITSLATKLNVEPHWIEKAVGNNFVAGDALTPGSSIPLKESLKPQNMEIHWDFKKGVEISNKLLKQAGMPVNKNATVMVQTLPDGANNIIYGELGWQYRVTYAVEAMKNASAAVLGAEKYAKLLELTPDIATKMAGQGGAGAGLLKFSNADYGDPLGLWSQVIGGYVNIWGREAANNALSSMQSVFLRLQASKEAGAEAGILVTALRRTPEKFVFHPDKPKTLINIETLTKGENGAPAFDEAVAKELEKAGRRSKFEIENDDVAEMFHLHQEANAARLEKMKVLMTSRGFNYNYDPRVIYAPPVDTARYPYFAFVRKFPETLGGSSETSMITARTEADLRALTAKVPDGYDVLFDRNTKEFFKAKGEYDYALTLKEPTIDSTLQRRGVLGDFFPETRAENVLDDFINWHQRQEVSVVRRTIETRYAQTFEELRSIGRQFQEVGESKFGGILKKFRSQVENPFEDYLKTALDISKRSEYTLLHEANEFAEALGKSAYRIFGANMQKAMNNTVSWQEANRISERYGLAGPYRDAETYFKANLPEDRNIIKEFVSKANMALVNITLRLDQANSIVNIVSTPILLGTELASIRNLVASDSELAGKLRELRSIAVPGQEEIRVPSTLSLLAGSLKNFFGDQKAELLERYKSIGAVKAMLSQYHEMIEHFSYKPYQKASELIERGNKAIEIGAKITGSEFAEQLTRFVSADVMRQLTDPIVAASKMTVAEQNAYISVFVNRVQGNYLASQRPIAFQGVLGSAVSLFQTYQFNLLQQLFRHVENRDTKALATLAGLQAGIYGLNGVPFFEAINTHLIGNSSLNPQHRDFYSTAPQLAGKELGDWLMYGTASAFPLWSSSSPSLYTRGDINPRHISIIPITPLDVPAVDGSIRFVKNLADTGKKLVAGADISSTLLEGLEHNGLSRPLAGIAQVAQGYSTTSKGSLISAANDWNAIAIASRTIGAKPMDESLALNSLFRLNAYQVADSARIQDLGEVVKTKLRAGKLPSQQDLADFQLEYAKSGGRIENYARTLQRWSRDANTSVVNQLAQQHRSSYSQRLQEIMGGTTLPDFRNAKTAIAPVAGTPEIPEE